MRAPINSSVGRRNAMRVDGGKTEGTYRIEEGREGERGRRNSRLNDPESELLPLSGEGKRERESAKMIPGRWDEQKAKNKEF